MTAPIGRVDEDRIRQFIGVFSPGRAELTVAAAVRGIAYMLRATVPPHGHAWLTRLAHHRTNTAKRSRPKLPRMAPVVDLVELGSALMDEGRTALLDGRVRGAQIYRDGLMIACLATRPLRRRNLAALQIGISLLIDEQGVHVRFGAQETKTRAAMEWDYPDWLREPIIWYVEKAREVLRRRDGGPDEGWLWIGRRGCRMQDHDISQRVARVTTQRLGRTISPHMFRDCVATEIAIHDPQHVGITKTVLGHATLASSQKYYNQAGSFAASRRYQDVLARRRRKACNYVRRQRS